MYYERYIYMKNMLKEYLGNDYSSDHLKNFCLYFDGDLYADTLMSAWTPIEHITTPVRFLIRLRQEANTEYPLPLIPLFAVLCEINLRKMSLSSNCMSPAIRSKRCWTGIV